jgi:hypothetical protein
MDCCHLLSLGARVISRMALLPEVVLKDLKALPAGFLLMAGLLFFHI